MENLARPVQPLPDPLKCPRGGNSPRTARCLSVLHLEHLCCHRLPLHIFRLLQFPALPGLPRQAGRGGGIRTPTSGFGDRRSTIEPTPLYPDVAAGDRRATPSPPYFRSLCAV